MLSINEAVVPKIAAPPNQIAKELNQQQLVPTKKVAMLANKVFIYPFITLFYCGN